MNKRSKNLPVGTTMKRKIKNGSSTPKVTKPRPTSRFVEIKIRLTAEEYARGLPYFQELKYLPRFFLDAYTEKVNRAESNSKAARLRILAGNVELLEPIIKEMFLREVEFFRKAIQGGVDG